MELRCKKIILHPRSPTLPIFPRRHSFSSQFSCISLDLWQIFTPFFPLLVIATCFWQSTACSVLRCCTSSSSPSERWLEKSRKEIRKQTFWRIPPSHSRFWKECGRSDVKTDSFCQSRGVTRWQHSPSLRRWRAQSLEGPGQVGYSAFFPQNEKLNWKSIFCWEKKKEVLQCYFSFFYSLKGLWFKKYFPTSDVSRLASVVTQSLRTKWNITSTFW